MEIKRHISSEIIDKIIAGDLPVNVLSDVESHLSDCQTCRDQRDEQYLKLAAAQMWDAYEDSGLLEGRHLDAEVLERFWKGEIKDERLLEQVSEHCIVCRSCRHKRRLIGAAVEREMVQRRGLLLLTVVGAAKTYLWRYKWHGLGAGMFLLVAVVGMWPGRTRPQDHAVNTTPKVLEAPVIPAPPAKFADNTNNPLSIAELPPQNRPKTRRHSQRHSELLLAKNQPPPQTDDHAQYIDLTAVSTNPDVRSGEVIGEQVYSRIVRSGQHKTLLKIGLPEGSQQGAYVVSIDEPAYMKSLVPGKATSSDGKELAVHLKIKNLPEGKYYLYIARVSEEGEYGGHYPVYITDSKGKVTQSFP